MENVSNSEKEATSIEKEASTQLTLEFSESSKYWIRFIDLFSGLLKVFVPLFITSLGLNIDGSIINLDFVRVSFGLISIGLLVCLTYCIVSYSDIFKDRKTHYDYERKRITLLADTLKMKINFK